MSSIGDQFHRVVHNGVERLKRLPAQVLQHIPTDQVQLAQSQGKDHDVMRLRSAYLQQTSRPDGMEMRPATAREIQLQNDREFFHAHRDQLQGQNWAQRGRDGQLHLREHSSKAADMMMAIDQTTRVEAAPLHYMAGELQGGAETIKDTARLAKTVAQPFTTLQSLVESDAGKALDHFRQNSAQITVDAVHQAGSDFLAAQNDPNKGGRATGKLGTNILLAAMPMPVPRRLIGLRGLAADAPKGIPELGPYPNKIWRFHPEHTRPTRPQGSVPRGAPEKLPPKCAETARSIQRQNESADLLASRGYDVERLDQIPNQKSPDFQIEGRIFDNYAPRRGSARNMASDIYKEKILGGQTERVVVNLDDSPLGIAALKEQLQTWPIDGLKEVIAIRKGVIEHIYP